MVLAMFIILGNLALKFTTISDSSVISLALQELFTIIPRSAIASFISYLIAQSFDIWFFHAIREKTGRNKLWLRNNLSIISSMLLDSLTFFPLAFYGMVSTNVLLTLILTGWLFKISIAILDTPFMYLSYVVKGQTPPDFEKLKTSKIE